MTLQEVCEKYSVAESSLKKNFSRTQESIKKKYGVKIYKEGRGSKVQYFEMEDDGRANTLYEEVSEEDIPFSQDNMTLMNWDFMVFLVIIIAPMRVFRGSYIDFLKYVELPDNNSNIDALKKSLNNLQNQGLVQYDVDKTDDTYFVAYLYREVEKNMKVGLDMVKDCKRLQVKYHKRSWVPILKVWLSIDMFVEQGHQPYTTKDIMAMTGLSDYQVRESAKLLKDSNVFRSSRAYRGYARCLGTVADLNIRAFYELDKKE